MWYIIMCAGCAWFRQQTYKIASTKSSKSTNPKKNVDPQNLALYCTRFTLTCASHNEGISLDKDLHLL